MPAEWEPMVATWLGWPVHEGREYLWTDYYDVVCSEFALVAQTIAKYQRCIVTAHPTVADHAKRLCGSHIEVVKVSAEENWIRDYGPTFLVNEHTGEQAAIVCQFNIWGKKYELVDAWGKPYGSFEGCKKLGDEISALANVDAFHSDMVLEGGAFFMDGQGTLLTTESCLLNKNRNPHMNRKEIEQELTRLLGAQKIIWLPGSEIETETNGHIDGIASFCAPGKVLLTTATHGSEFYVEAQENRRALELATDVNGRHFEILELPMPSVSGRLGPNPDRHCDIYSNYILVNGAVISIQYDVPEDEIVKEVFAKAYPGRDVILLPARHIGLGGGSIHCSTQQQPMLGNRLPDRF
jgi:agmatine deiminase